MTVKTYTDAGNEANREVMGERVFSIHDVIQVFEERQCYQGPYFMTLKHAGTFHLGKEDYDRVKAAFTKFIGEE